MKWSFRLATIAGTEVRVHLTFFLLLLFVAVQGTGGGQGADGGLAAVVLVCAMFFCVLLHEFGHVFAARMYGIKTPDITLLPIGGVARLERMPRTPLHEFVVALAGPMVNVAIAAGIAIVLGLRVRFDANYAFHQSGGFWQHLMMWNIFMVVFNLVPAFPMDGGRILRALLAMVTDYEKATRWAATMGQGIAALVVVGMLGVHVDPVLRPVAPAAALGQEPGHAAPRRRKDGRELRRQQSPLPRPGAIGLEGPRPLEANRVRGKAAGSVPVHHRDDRRNRRVRKARDDRRMDHPGVRLSCIKGYHHALRRHRFHRPHPDRPCLSRRVQQPPLSHARVARDQGRR